MLLNGPGRCAGRVEIFYQGRWGPVCDDNWDSRRGQVVCRQLDCGAVLSAPANAAFGIGSGEFWLDDVTCNGTERQLSECRAMPWGQHNCNPREAASAVCSGDLPKPNISISNSDSGGFQLACVVPPLHQDTVVYFYQAGVANPINTVQLTMDERNAVHVVNRTEAWSQSGYLCQYEVKAARTAQLFMSPQSDNVTVQERQGSTRGPATATTEGLSLPTGNDNNSMVLAASIGTAVVVFLVVNAGVAFVCIKRRCGASVGKKAGTVSGNAKEDMINGRGQAQSKEPTNGKRGAMDGSPYVLHHYENHAALRAAGPPDHYQQISPPSKQPEGLYSELVKPPTDPEQEGSNIYETMTTGNQTTQAGSSNAESSVYQTLCMGTLEDSVYDTLHPGSV
ncbi:deleted in malignant brain tumors 1 protein-like [Ambystoma mexicanum]|uniref:deleted in malignant brain tumors 1 protein-like n=1 Tax=Ambystoma mexicanum TaxID=8296 RepID=UPI0037E9A7C4